MPSAVMLNRKGDLSGTVAATVLLAASQAMDARPYAGGMVRASASGTYQVYVSFDGDTAEGGTDDYEISYDQDGGQMTLVLTKDVKKELPSWWFSLPWVKFVGVAGNLTFYSNA